MASHPVLAGLVAVFALAAVPAFAESEAQTSKASAKDKQLMLRGWWDPSAETVDDEGWRSYLALHTLEAYLTLKPRTEVGNAPHIPGILRGGLCSDPAGEGR